MNLTWLRAATTPLLTLALGGVTALGVALASFDVLWDAAAAQEDAFHARLELAAAQAGASGMDLLRSAEGAPDDAGQARLSEIVRITGVEGAAVLDPSGAVLAWAGAGARGLATQAREACLAQGLNPRRLETTRTFEGRDGRTLRAACAPVTDEAGAPLGQAISVAEPTWLAEQEARGAQTRALIVFMGSLVGLGVIVGVRFILAPIREAADAAERMAAGERGVRVPVPGDPEIARVAIALNELGSALEAREDEIRARLASMGQLTSMVAHEVRNPLQSLSLLATLARTERDPVERETMLSSIESEIQVLEGVVQRFLRSSGPLQISRAPADLVEVVTKAMGVATAQARARQVALELQAPSHLQLSIDPSLVRRAVENLVLNAVEFSGQEAQGRVRVEIARKGREALIIVDDNGPGVPREERDRVFKAYYSSKAGGTGLGLALVKQVFQAHDGAVRCEDSPLRGARFVATLPIDESLEVPFAR